MKFPSREIVESIRREYPAGTRVELVQMDDVQAPPAGTKGTVKGVDDTGSLLMRWDNGSGLNVVYGEVLSGKFLWSKQFVMAEPKNGTAVRRQSSFSFTQ